MRQWTAAELWVRMGGAGTQTAPHANPNADVPVLRPSCIGEA